MLSVYSLHLSNTNNNSGIGTQKDPSTSIMDYWFKDYGSTLIFATVSWPTILPPRAFRVDRLNTKSRSEYLVPLSADTLFSTPYHSNLTWGTSFAGGLSSIVRVFIGAAGGREAASSAVRWCGGLLEIPLIRLIHG